MSDALAKMPPSVLRVQVLCFCRGPATTRGAVDAARAAFDRYALPPRCQTCATQEAQRQRSADARDARGRDFCTKQRSRLMR
jgi:hypothetical protein